MKKRKGISLIVLVITIIIIIILAGAVILNLADNNPIDSAEKSKIMSDLDSFNSDLTIQIGQKYLTDYSLTTQDLDSRNQNGWRIIDLVPSIKGTEYENLLTVENGKLKLRIDAKLEDTTKEIIEEKLGKAVLSKEMIFENEENIKKYIGMQVEYEGYLESTNTIDWRLFGVDNEGNLMLKANDYVDLSYKTTDFSTGIEAGSHSSYCIKSTTDRETLINYLGTSSNWNEYAINGTIARAAMTLPEFVSGYNLVNDEKLEVKYFNKGDIINSSELKESGYLIKKMSESDDTYSDFILKITQVYQGMNYYMSDTDKAYVCWLANKNPKSLEYVYGLGYKGDISYENYYNINFGICPVISLTTVSIVEKEDGTLKVELN